MCRALGVSEQGYYRALRRPEQGWRDRELLKQIYECLQEDEGNGRNYGLNPKFCVNSQRGENRSEFNVRGSGFIRLPLVCSITPAGMDVKGGGKAAVHRSAVQRRADP